MRSVLHKPAFDGGRCWRTPPYKSDRSNRLLAVVAVLVLAVTASACGAGASEVSADPGALRHVHDFAIADDGSLLAASHTGLYRIEGLERAVLVGTKRHDLMVMIRKEDGDLLAGNPICD